MSKEYTKRVEKACKKTKAELDKCAEKYNVPQKTILKILLGVK